MKKGVALLWVMVLSAILMIIAGSMVGYITRESKFSVRIEDSSKAYAAAKSAIDWARTSNNLGLNETKTFVSEEDSSGNNLVYAVVVRTTDTHYESTGFSGDVKRKIEYDQSSSVGYSIVPTSGNVQDPGNGSVINSGVASPGANIVSNNVNSFTLQYDFWVTGNTQFDFGLDNSTDPSKYITMAADFSSKTITLKADDANGSATTASFVIADADLTDKGRPWNYRAEIKYVKDTAASIKVRKVFNRGLANQSYQCLGYKSIDLTGQSFGDLNSFSLAGPVNSDVHYLGGGTATPDGSYFQFKDVSNQSSYVDNVILRASSLAFTTGGQVPTASANVEPTPIYPTPSCTLTPSRTGLSSYSMAWSASNFTSGSKSESSNKDNSWIFSAISSSGTVMITPFSGATTYTMSLNGPGGTASCSKVIVKGTYYATDATATSHAEYWMNISNMVGQPNALLAQTSLPSPSAANSTTIEYVVGDGLPVFEATLRLRMKSAASTSLSIKLRSAGGTYGSSVTTNIPLSAVLKDTSSIDLSSILPSGGYDRVQITFTGSLAGSGQTVDVDSILIN